MLGARMALWNAAKRLPYDAEVEFLESTGTQYIDTGLNYFADFEITAKLRTSVSNVTLYAGNSNRLERNSATFPNWRFRSDAGGIYNTTVPITELHTLAWRSGKVYSDGVEITTHAKNFPANRMYVFGFPTTQYPAMVYALKLWNANGVLVRDYIPVRKGTVGYLYDRVSGKLFGNAGTGDFVLGPDVVPVEYIESHGTEWIDTGFKASNSTRIAVDFERTGGTTNCWILGARNGTASATDKFALFCAINSDIAYAMIGSAVGQFSSATIKTGRHLLEMSLAGGVVVDSQVVATYSATEQAEVFSAAYAMTLFNLWNGSGLNNPFIGKYYACDFWDNGDAVRKFRPIRVGTDATSWEGAMMDVLTRRIYRNAGTGAFTWGNDLKYPIPAE